MPQDNPQKFYTKSHCRACEEGKLTVYLFPCMACPKHFQTYNSLLNHISTCKPPILFSNPASKQEKLVTETWGKLQDHFKVFQVVPKNQQYEIKTRYSLVSCSRNPKYTL